MLTHTHTGSRPNWASHAGRPITTTGSEPIRIHGRSLTDQTPEVPALIQCGHGTIPRHDFPSSTSQPPFLLSLLSYPYDNVGNRVSMRDVMGLHSYGYDKLYRLKAVDYPAAPDQTYTYT